MTDHQDYYVYALFRPDGTTPFYIGKGRGQRIFIHERDAAKDTSHKGRILQAMIAAGIAVPKAKLLEGLNDTTAKEVERALIQLIGRWPIGPLANLTAGGDGVERLSQESRAKKSEANVRSWKNPEVRAARSNGMKAVWTPEKRQIHREKKVFTPEIRKKISDACKAAWARRKGQNVLPSASISVSHPP
jgi:hypothetical protein